MMMSSKIGLALAGLCMAAWTSTAAAQPAAAQTYLDGAATTGKGGAEPLPIATLLSETWLEQVVGLSGTGVGSAVAIKDDTAFFAAPNTDTFRGAVHVIAPYVCESLCMPSVYDTLLASDGAAYDRFGASLAFDGTTLLVGATGAAIGGRTAQGAVYVFTWNDGVWTQTQKLTAFDGAAEDRFGVSVAVSGGNAVVGAYTAGVDGDDGRGAAYRFTRGVDGVWTFAQKLTASDGGRYEQYGVSVGISDDTAMVGSRWAYQFGYYSVGAVYVYSRECHAGRCNPRWRETQKLVGSPTSTDMDFGSALAFDGTTAVIGAPWALTGPENDPIQRASGAVYVFTRQSGLWTQRQQLVASDSERNWRFGSAVAVDGASLIVGAVGVGWPTTITGAAYVFDRDGSGVWSEVKKLAASGGTHNDYFGSGVGLSGLFAIIGAPQGPNNSGIGTGYFFYRGCGPSCM
ncbi:MAG: FG-GAP repeat protein [Dokdonella sp.]|nr:FG-GAP repeat protein [Dokdonella sp.]